MSIDLIVLRPLDEAATDLGAVEDVHILASAETIEEIVEEAFPGIESGIYCCANEYTVELMLSGDPVHSIHVSLHSGPAWTNESHVSFILQLSSVCAVLGAQAFVVSDNSRVELAAVF